MENLHDEISRPDNLMIKVTGEPPLFLTSESDVAEDSYVGSTECTIWFRVRCSRVWLIRRNRINVPNGEPTESVLGLQAVEKQPEDIFYSFLSDDGPSEAELRELLFEAYIPEVLWERFFQLVTDHLNDLEDVVRVEKPLGVELPLEVDVVTEQDVDEELFERMVGVLMESLGSADDNEQDNVKPASQSSINALETREFEKLLENDSGDDLCSICLNEYADGVKITKMPCSHEFHSGCIKGWLGRMNTCPQCRFEMPLETEI